MFPGFSFLFSSCRLVERLVPYRRRGDRSWLVSGFAVLLVASRRGVSSLVSMSVDGSASASRFITEVSGRAEVLVLPSRG